MSNRVLALTFVEFLTDFVGRSWIQRVCALVVRLILELERKFAHFLRLGSLVVGGAVGAGGSPAGHNRLRQEQQYYRGGWS